MRDSERKSRMEAFAVDEPELAQQLDELKGDVGSYTRGVVADGCKVGAAYGGDMAAYVAEVLRTHNKDGTWKTRTIGELLKADFDESAHPRADDGKFAETGGVGASPRPHKPRRLATTTFHPFGRYEVRATKPDPQTKTCIEKHVTDLEEWYPQLRKSLDRIAVGEVVDAAQGGAPQRVGALCMPQPKLPTEGGAISNVAICHTLDNLRGKELSGGTTTALYSTPEKRLQSIVTHELGHVLHFALHASARSEWFLIATRYLNHAADAVRENISEYALTNHHELLAEAFVVFDDPALRDRLPSTPLGPELRDFFYRYMPGDGTEKMMTLTLADIFKNDADGEKSKQIAAIFDDFKTGTSTVVYSDGSEETTSTEAEG